jgi:hypothetical protein
MRKWLIAIFTMILVLHNVASAETTLEFYNKQEHTYVNLALATINASEFDDMTEKQLQEMLRAIADAMGPAGFEAFFEAFLEEYSIPARVTVRNVGTLEWNKEVFLKSFKLVYGTPQDVAKVRTNDEKQVNGKTEYRFLGFDSFGNPYVNSDFPPDALGSVNVGARNWLPEPWNHKDELAISVLPETTEFMLDAVYPRERQMRWLQGIQDHYVENGTIENFSGTKRGNWDPNWPAEKLLDYAVIQQPPIGTSPGQATLWHRTYYVATNASSCETPIRAAGRHAKWGFDYRTGKTQCFLDWYETFYLAPEMDIVNMLVQYWDDLRVTARWLQQPNGVEWPNEGYAQPAGTPVILYANVQGVLPRLSDETIKDFMDSFASANQMLNYFEVNGQPTVKAKVYFVQDSTKSVIGIVPVDLANAAPPTPVWIEWQYPEKDDIVYAVVVPDFEQNPGFREFFLQNNVMAIPIKVSEKSPFNPTPINGDGLDNIKINAFIPHPGNGGKKPGERIDYRTVVQAELPTDYIRISFNGGSQSNPIPMYPEVVSRLNEISSWDYVYVSRSGTSVNVSASPQISYIGTCTDPEGEPYPCTKWRTNPNYSRAQSAVSQLASQWNSIQATVTVQGKTCTVTLVRGGPEQSCVIEGTMPNTESFVYSKVEGAGVREWTYADNEARVMMYPILTKETDATNSTGTVEYHQLDPKTGAATKNTQTEPAKFGQQVRITVSSSPNLEYMETRYGYPLFRMNTEYANIRYGTGRLRYVPQGGTFEVSGNTPSATYNGISKQSTDNKTWNNDFENIAKGGSNIKYLYDVERRERSYGPWTWYEYETFWANCSDCKDLNGNTKPLVRAEVETTWRTKKDHHWIVDLVKTDDSPIGYWPQYGTLPPLKDGVPTPISQGGKPQTVKPVFTYKHNDKTRGVITKQINDAPNIHMFGTVVTSIGGGS